MGKIGATQRLFSGRANKDWAREIVRVHPRMDDYIQQAPVIISVIEAKHFPMLRALCDQGARLREFMAELGLNPALRNVHPHAVIRLHRALYEFDWTNVSALAQQLRKRDAKQQREYFSHVIRFKDKIGMGGLAHHFRWFEWVAENIPVGEHDAGHYADYFAHAEPEQIEFSKTWKWRDFLAALKKWEQSFARVTWDEASTTSRVAYANMMQGIIQQIQTTAPSGRLLQLQEEIYRQVRQTTGLDGSFALLGPSAPLSPHKTAIQSALCGEYAFVHANTRDALHIEGAMMQHCVGGYVPQVSRGTSLIYSIRKDGERVATMELCPASWEAKTGDDRTVASWYVGQIKGVKNSTPPQAVLDAARAFAKANFKIGEEPGVVSRSNVQFYERFAMRMVQPNRNLYFNDIVA